MSGCAELIGRFWPEWQVEERLGKGSYGVVYACKRADETGVVTRSAIKVIRIPKERDEEDPEDEEILPEQSESYLESVVRDLAEDAIASYNDLAVAAFNQVKMSDEDKQALIQLANKLAGRQF